MINDNGDGRGPDHRIVSEILRANLARKGMTDTLGVHLFTVNTETYNGDTAQRAWLKDRLARITADPASMNKPILIQGHRPAPGIVMDDQQTANPLLTQDLAGFPQAVYLSGHSHLNINDERSIAQKDFTAVNDGSMSYVEVDHGYQAITDTGLADRFEATTAQALFIEVYKDRTEIARVNMNADKHDIYRGGTWSAIRGRRTPARAPSADRSGPCGSREGPARRSRTTSAAPPPRASRTAPRFTSRRAADGRHHRRGRHRGPCRPGDGRPDGPSLRRDRHGHDDRREGRLRQGALRVLLHAPPQHPRHPRRRRGPWSFREWRSAGRPQPSARVTRSRPDQHAHGGDEPSGPPSGTAQVR
ncbi:hypothetical protein [Streptomyces sp. NPDC055094]